MTIGNTEPVNIAYGNNLATTFDYDFYIETEEQIIVEHTNLVGVKTTLVCGVDYSVSGVGNENGGQITFPLQGSTYDTLAWNEQTDQKEMLVISLNLPFEQSSEFDISGDLNKHNLEKALDYQMRCTQILNRKVGRAVLVSEGAESTPEQLISSIEEAKVISQSFAQTAEQKAADANASAIAAGEEATIATQKAAEVSETYNEAMSEIASAQTTAVNAVETAQSIAEAEIITGRENIAADLSNATISMNATKQNVINDIQALGIFMEDDRLFYFDVNGVKHEFRNDFGGIAPMAVKHKEVKKVENGFLLTWTDPDDSVYQNNVYCTWGKTRIVRKLGSYPESPFDGDVIIETTVRNQYAEIGYLDEVDTTKDYKYRAFPCSINKVYSLDDFNKFGIWIYSYTRIMNEATPADKIVYRGANEHYKNAFMNFSSGQFDYGDWKDAPFLLKDRLAPCIVGFDGELKYFLDINDYKKKEDGTPSEVTDTSKDINAFMRIGLLFRRKRKNADGDTEVDISNVKVNDEYKPYGGFVKPDGTLREYIYMPIYRGSLINNKCRSMSGNLTPMSSQTAQNERTYCQANGAGHDMITHSDRELIEDLAILMLKNTDTQSALGQGKSNGGDNVGACLKSGTMDEKGLFYGSTSTAEGVKILGMENRYASQWERVLGEVLVNGVRKVKLCQGTSDGSTVDDYNFTGEGYISLDELPKISGTSGGYISKEQTVDDIGTFPIVISGSSSTYECDGMWYNNSGTMVALRGGASHGGAICGLFCSTLNNPASDAAWSIGSSVSFKPL